MLLYMYKIFSSLRSHLHFFMHFFFTFMEYFFCGHPILRRQAVLDHSVLCVSLPQATLFVFKNKNKKKKNRKKPLQNLLTNHVRANVVPIEVVGVKIA